MAKTDAGKELEKLLKPFITNCGATSDSVYPDSVEAVIDFAECTGVEEEVLTYVKEHKNFKFWDLMDLIPPGYDDADDDDICDE